MRLIHMIITSQLIKLSNLYCDTSDKIRQKSPGRTTSFLLTPKL